MRYFKELALWKIILLNIVVGLCMSGPFILGIIYSFGLFTSPSPKERILGILIFLMILAAILLSNFLLWKFGKKKEIEPAKEVNKKTLFAKPIILLIILVLAVVSFFVLPDLWIFFNSWWF